MIEFNEVEYPSRTFLVELEGDKQEITISVDSLLDAFDGEHEEDGTEAESVDSTIYFYLEDEVITDDAVIMCDSYLDVPIKFISEL